MKRPAAQERLRRPDGEPARVLLFSMRNITQHVARCSGYEFEDVIAQCDRVDVIAPSPANESRLGRFIRSIVAPDAARLDAEVTIDQDYDLFFAFCLNAMDLRFLRAIDGVRERCRRSICVIGELWPGSISASGRALQTLSRFDLILSGIAASVDAIRAITGRPCRFMPFGVDAARFCPLPKAPPRTIDVYNIGRRHEPLHQRLAACADRGDLLYLHDTVGDFAVMDVREHRRLLANLVKRSRYFIAYPPKFDRPAETGGLEEIGTRFFEGAAGGAVMLGRPSRCESYEKCFDWTDAVIPVAPDGRDIVEVIAALESDRERTDTIRRSGIVHSLRRHDWLYRWREILNAERLPETALMLERERRLEEMAQTVANGAAVDPQPRRCGIGNRP